MTTRPDIHTAREFDEPVTLAYDRVLTMLNCGDVQTEHGLMRWGSNYTFLVTVREDDTAFLGVYKPRMGERPLWDFPDGTLCQRETAAYTLSEALGWHIVPPTVLRDGPRGIGSVQVFINHDPNRHYFTFDNDGDKVPQLQRMALFDALANNADRKGGHCLVDENERIWGIDHGLTFHSMTKLRTVIWDYAGQPIPQPLLSDLSELCGKLDDPQDAYYQALDKLLSQAEMGALRRRINGLLQNGTYPMPGPGPNRPWPAV